MAQNIFRRFVSEANAVLKVAANQSARVLGQFGGYARKVAQQSIKKADGSSQVNHPPHGHAEQLLKKMIFYAVNREQSNVIIGPARLNGMTGDAPRALEYGRKSKIRRGGRRSGRVETIKIKPRPYIGPAAAKAEQALPGMWAKSIQP